MEHLARYRDLGHLERHVAPEHGYLTPAKLLAITANGLSYEDAVSAKEIPANLERRDDQRGYLAFQRGLFRKQRYAYDLQMAPQ